MIARQRWLLVFATSLVLLGTSCGASVGTYASEPLEFYNEGCEGLLFQSRVSGTSAILSRTKTDGTDAGSLVFESTGGEWTFVPSKSDNLIVDNEPRAIAVLESGRICYRFGPEDETQDSCFVSLISTGAICTKVTPSAGP